MLSPQTHAQLERLASTLHRKREQISQARNHALEAALAANEARYEQALTEDCHLGLNLLTLAAVKRRFHAERNSHADQREHGTAALQA